MLYGQIIVLLIILLALYYAGMITMDILAANKAKASECIADAILRKKDE